MAVNTRPYDIVVFGATGFTGRQTAHYLAQYAPATLRLAVAGRSRDKLETLVASLSRKDVGVIVADSAAPDTIDAMCAAARVVCSTAGPFLLYGTPVVEGCVKHRTHYCDITGETPWVRDMIDRFQEQAVADGTKLVPFSGYDSCPSDLGTYVIAKELAARGEQAVRVDGFHSLRGGFNGGTLATMLGMAEHNRLGAVAKPFLLNPGPAPEGHVKPDSRDPRRVFFHARAERYAAPFMMGTINTRVVRRTAALLAGQKSGYADDFVYQEYWGSKSKAAAYVMLGTLGVVNEMVQHASTRVVVKKLGPRPGEGPSEQSMDGGHFRSRFFGLSDRGSEIEAEISGPGDPGNRVTVRFLGESALTLALDHDRAPKAAGFLTPVTAHGDILLERVRARGMTATIVKR